MGTDERIEFSGMFMASKGQPVLYKGRTLVMLDRWDAEPGDRFEVTIESTSSSLPQGVGISDGVELFGQTTNRAVVWEYFSVPPTERDHTRSKLPFKFEVTCRNRKGHLAFYNMTEFKNRQEWWSLGHAMIAEEIPGGRRYRCNDFEPDDDFDDIVFVVRKL